MKFFLIILLSLFATPAGAATYYVSPTGADTTCAAALLPASPAGPRLRFVLDCLKSGDTLIARGGNYDEPLHKPDLFGFFPSGTAATPTRFTNYPGETPWLRTVQHDPWSAVFEFSSGAAHITFDGINFDGFVPPEHRGFAHEYVPVKIQKGAHHIRLLNGEVKNLPDGWFSSNNGNNNEVSNFKIHGWYPASSYLSGGTKCGQSVCWGYPFYWNGPDNVLTANEITDVPSWVFHIYCSGPAYCNYADRTKILNNKISHYGFGDPNRAAGIGIYQGNLNEIISNTIWNGTVNPIVIGEGATNTVLKDNSFTPPVGNWIDLRTDRNVTLDARELRVTRDPQTKITINGEPRQ